MSTHCRIGIQNRDGSIRSSFCHYDGYLDAVGRRLLQDYSSVKKLNSLLGSLNSLWSYDLQQPEPYTDIDAAPAMLSKNVEEMIKQDGGPAEFFYVYGLTSTRKRKWAYRARWTKGHFLPLTKKEILLHPFA